MGFHRLRKGDELKLYYTLFRGKEELHVPIVDIKVLKVDGEDIEIHAVEYKLNEFLESHGIRMVSP